MLKWVPSSSWVRIGRGEYGGLVCLTNIVGPKLMLQLHNEASGQKTTNMAQIPLPK
jgi:hypothetical protein